MLSIQNVSFPWFSFQYKQKCGERDPESVKIEGTESPDWMAMDLGL